MNILYSQSVLTQTNDNTKLIVPLLTTLKTGIQLFLPNMSVRKKEAKGRKPAAPQSETGSQQTQAKEIFQAFQYLDPSVGPRWAPRPQQILQVTLLCVSHSVDFPTQYQAELCSLSLHYFHPGEVLRTLFLLLSCNQCSSAGGLIL